MRLFVIALLATAAGCASLNRQLYGIPSPAFSQSYGCHGEHTANGRRMAVEKQQDERRGPYIPQVGWNACRVLMEWGKPRDVNTQQGAHGRSATWWYGSGMDPIMVTLQERSGRWIVDYVGT